jgi:hypothetical protein
MYIVVCKESDECWNKEENEQEGRGGSDSQSQVELGRPYGKQGPVQKGTGYIYMVRKNRQNKNWATAVLLGRHVREGSRKTFVVSIQKPERMEQIQHL